MPLQSETIAIPVTKGIDVTTEARLVQPPGLLEATNSRFPRAGGATKRRGHTAVAIRGNSTQPAGLVATSGTGWLFGFGYAYGGSLLSSTDTDTTIKPDFPDVGVLYGATQRDTESLLWNGHLLYSYASATGTTSQVASDAVMPTLTAAPIAKVQTGQLYPDYADTGVVKVVTWLDAAGLAYYAVYDSVTLTPLVAPKLLSAAGASFTAAYQMRVTYLGAYVHIFLLDSANNTLQLLTIHQTTPTASVVQRSLGACNSHFDICKTSDTDILVVKSNNPYLDIYWVGLDGSPSIAFLAYNIVPGTRTFDRVACAYHGVNAEIALAYSAPSDATTKAIVYVTGVTASTGAIIATTTLQSGLNDNVVRLSVTPKYFGTGGTVVDVYWDIYPGGVPQLWKRRCNLATGAVSAGIWRYHQAVASRAFTAGNRTFVWSGHNTALQSTWFLLDEGLNPVGHMDWGIANAPTATGTSFVATVNYSGAPVRNVPAVTSFHLCLGFRVRQPSADTVGVFSEPSIKTVSLNFLPKLRAVQGGRCTYFAGAQVWSYDGVELTEAGFHVGPELATPTVSLGGSLTGPGSYSYRVDLCYRNAQNEEIRSLSILTPSVATTAANKTITLQIPSCLTRRTNAYYLIYRNAVVAGTPLVTWWLLNSRDPASASFYPNDQTVAYKTVVDDGTVTDTAIQVFEQHPANVLNTYLQPAAAPACEVIAAGHDRLWVAGGELASGLVLPSRLFGAGETPAFNPYLAIQVDRGFEPITALGFTGDLKVFFRANNAYVLDGDGPDNSSNGLWGTPSLALADIGAVSQESLALVTPGLLFQSSAGIRLLSASGGLEPIGQPVDTLTKTLTVRAAVVANHDQEVRFYCEDQVVVYSYLYDAWSTWSFGSVGAVRLTSGLAAVARADGTLWLETEGTYTDGPNAYTHRIRFPWLHGGNLGDFQRVRRIQGLGRFDGTTHYVHVDLYYDERSFIEESFDWTMPDTASSNTDTWGAATWGAGVWGDTGSTTSAVSDQTWEWVRRPARQKCSVFSVAIDDNNTPGPGFVLTALGLEIAKKPGLNRTPERGGTESSR